MSEAVKQPPVGIDLGTTYSAVAYLDASGRPTTIINGCGDLLTPSALSFEESQVVVGKEAIKASVFEPADFAECFKRDMGSLRFRRAIGEHEVPPEVLSGFLLERLKQDAIARIGPFKQVVITVPAFFDETRRRATQEAGRLAGLDVLDIINEPTSAAVAFGYYRNLIDSNRSGTPDRPENILVYDLGGGTFDVTVLAIDGKKLSALATDGDVQLGGKDFDERLVDYLADAFLAAHGADPRSNPHDAAQLWLDAHDAKHTLSERPKVTIPCIHAGIRMRIDVTRSEFEKLTRDLLERTESTVQVVLRQAKLDWHDIDRVLLVGGASRMPIVGEMLRRVTGKEPDRSLSPDEAVAHGAAIYAGMLMEDSGRQSPSSLQVINVNSHSLGIIGLDRRSQRRHNSIVIPKNTPLPCKVVRKFVTARDNQSSVKVAIVEGESKQPEHCIALGECVVRNLPPGLPKNTAVEVEYRYAASGRISVVARVPSVRQSASVEIKHGASQNLATLDIWRGKLCGSFEAGGSDSVEAAGGSLSGVATDSNDPTAVLNRLDQLLAKLGGEMIRRRLPDAQKEAKAAAIAAHKERETATASFERLERSRGKAVGQSEILRATAAASQSRADVQLAETKLRYALLALARECIAAKCCPRELDQLLSEIDSVQRRIGVTI